MIVDVSSTFDQKVDKWELMRSGCFAQRKCSKEISLIEFDVRFILEKQFDYFLMTRLDCANHSFPEYNCFIFILIFGRIARETVFQKQFDQFRALIL